MNTRDKQLWILILSMGIYTLLISFIGYNIGMLTSTAIYENVLLTEKIFYQNNISMDRICLIDNKTDYIGYCKDQCESYNLPKSLTNRLSDKQANANLKEIIKNI
jgi:hypothetical protein